MGKVAIYHCNKCNNEFESSDGDNFHFLQHLCVNCDTLENVSFKIGALEKKVGGACEKCGGELKEGLVLMCPKCKSRDLKEMKIIMFYDP